MIRISLGNVGSGKTLMEVRNLYLNPSNRLTYSNIKTKLKNQVNLTPDMIIKKEVLGYKKNGEPITDYKLNVDFWKKVKKPVNIVLDEAHTILNSRRAMQKTNVLMTDWLALIRRVIGQADSGYGEVVFITQLPNRLDVIAREMATQVRYHVCHWHKLCKNCGLEWSEDSEMPEQLWACPSCNSFKLLKHSFVIEVWHFNKMDAFNMWKEWGEKTYYKHYLVRDIDKFFPLYDTLQWDNLFSNF